MGYLIRTLSVFVAITPVAVPQTSDVGQIERRGDSAALSVNTFRPLDATATKLESQFGFVVSAEDPLFQFRGDMMDTRCTEEYWYFSQISPEQWIIGFDEGEGLLKNLI